MPTIATVIPGAATVAAATPAPAVPVNPTGRKELAPEPVAAVEAGPRAWLRLEGLAVLLAGVAIFVAAGGPWPLLVPLVLLVDVSMAGYLVGPRPGAALYNLAHNQVVPLVLLGGGVLAGVDLLVLGGAVLLAHSGMDRLAGYGLKYPTAFRDTHLGRIGR